MASLKDEAHRASCKQKNETARSFTIRSLQEMKINCIPSYTNFIFFPLSKYQGNFSEDMFAKNIFLRSNNYDGEKWARVSVGTLPEMKQFIDLMKVVWKG